ncbi:MAG TPA: 4-hydroxy-tetrahydrodipicolinate reductase [Gemmatimonadaceae bacterium]|nr:4-hydroxy-tetrahydrodipicolinate reductase [Gemmatimonadaceae bacterium]
MTKAQTSDGTARRLAIIGTGKMGRAVEEIAAEHGWSVVARIDERLNADGHGITPATLAGADVAVEFTTPLAAAANVIACARAGCPVVVGTTGWYDRLGDVSRQIESLGGTMLWAPNFSLGVNLFLRVAETAARLAARLPGIDVHIVETHHAAKLDAPSGTAAELRRVVQRELGAGVVAEGEERNVPVTSIRVGHVPGTHTLLLDGRYEQLRIEHEARDRRVFAEGALVAAAWLAGRKRPGVFTMRDVLEESR